MKHRIYTLQIVVEATQIDRAPSTDEVCDAVANLFSNDEDPDEYCPLHRRLVQPRYVGVNHRDKRGPWRGPFASSTDGKVKS